MCDDHAMVLDDNPPAEPAKPVRSPDRVTRRRFMQTTLAAAGSVLLPAALARQTALAGRADGTSAFSMAMHIHTSFSEQSGSIAAHLAQALDNEVDVLWLTDHDHRMLEIGYRNVVHFTSLTAEATDGEPWQWQQQVAGPLTASSSGGIVTDPASPNDSVAGGSLRVSAQSSTSSLASLGFFAQSMPANLNYHCNLYGQTWTIDVLPSSIGPDGYLELQIASSYHPAGGGRPAGFYSLSYRFGGSGAAGRRVADGSLGIVTLDVVPGKWNTVSLTPTEDIAALWPDLQARDFASFGLTLSAASTGGLASGYFDFLRFGRQHNTGNIPVQTQAQVMRAYAPAYRGVTQHQGLEISGSSTHVNWFGPGVALGDYTGVTDGPSYDAFVQEQVATIHTRGGVASYNHPFGTSGAPLLPVADQDARLADVTAALLANDVLDCDILEVGYTLRGQCDLAHHVALWDVLSRNGRFLTGNGTNDDHYGQDWSGLASNWFTSVWAHSTAERDLVRALRAGRAWMGSLSRFRGDLDLVVDGRLPMGSVSVSSARRRSLRVVATGVPAGGSVQVLRGVCDFTGTTANTAVIASFPAAALRSGAATVAVDTSSSCFVRTQVLDSTGQVVALSNPVWLLRERPPRGIPAARAH
jgi:hypothetical protein